MAGVLTKIQNLVEGYDWEDVKQFCLNNVRTALVFGVSVTALWLMFRKPRGIPPGPRFTLPVIGDLLQLASETDPRIMMRNLRKRYGDIFSLYTGPKLMICLNGYDTIKEALVKNGDRFSDRPPFFVNDAMMDHKGLLFSPGQVWKDQRKFALETLREFGLGKTSMEGVIKNEIEEFIAVLNKHSDQPYDICRLTQKAVSNVIASLMFGKRFEYENADFCSYLTRMEENFHSLSVTTFVNFYPFLRFFPGDKFNFRKVIGNTRFLENIIIDRSIKEHEENFDDGDIRDFIDGYLNEMKRSEAKGDNSNITRENLPKTIVDLFVAGTETTSTVILWMILYFLHYPEIQARCYKEVQDVVGSGRLPCLRDRDAMKYTQAVLLEVLRAANIVLLGLPHTVKQDTIFRGFLIPKDSVIMPNIDSIMSDEEIWGDPDSFRPDRFLNSDGQIIKKEEFIPFSVGRRFCLGESLAKMELFLFLTMLVQRFEFKPVDPHNLPTLKGVIGVTHSPAKYQVLASRRF